MLIQYNISGFEIYVKIPSFLSDYKKKSNFVNGDKSHVRFIKLLENLSQERAPKYPTMPVLV